MLVKGCLTPIFAAHFCCPDVCWLSHFVGQNARFSDRILFANFWRCSVPGTKASLQLKLEFRLDDVGGANGGRSKLCCIHPVAKIGEISPTRIGSCSAKMEGLGSKNGLIQNILDSIKDIPGYSPRNIGKLGGYDQCNCCKGKPIKTMYIFLMMHVNEIYIMLVMICYNPLTMGMGIKL